MVNYQLRNLIEYHGINFVDLIMSYLIQINKQKENLNLKAVTMIDPVTGWSEVTHYNDKREVSMAKLVETEWLSKYPRLHWYHKYLFHIGMNIM